MILAAGMGERMGSQTTSIPKPLLEVGGRPVIEWALEYLGAYGVSDVVINVSHHQEQIVEYVGEEFTTAGGKEIAVAYSREKEPLGAGGGLKKAEALLRKGGDEFIVLNAVVIIDANLHDIVEAHREAGADVTMVLRDDLDVDGYGAVLVDNKNNIRDIRGHAGVHSGPNDKKLMFTGLQVLSNRVFDYLPGAIEGGDIDTVPFSSTTADAFPRMIADGLTVQGFVHEGLWGKIETPTGYAALESLIAEYGIEHFIDVQKK